MTGLLINFVKNLKSDTSLRDRYSNLSGCVCILCNVLLFAVKLTIGTLTGSVAITADAINNLTDSATNIVSLIGTRLSGKPVDKEHPFGHGRLEYVSALIVAVSIFVVSFELAKGSVEKILHPAEIKFSVLYLAVLAGTVLVKLWMAYLNGRLYTLTDNLNLKGVKQDSLNDCVATTATIISAALSNALHIQWLDGAIGLGVSVFIFVSGIEILKGVISPLLGEAPSKETVQKIEDIITGDDVVLGVHDLIVHNYGAGKMIASAHAEVPADEDIVTVHDAIDKAEREILDELGIIMCIHMDPVETGDKELRRYKKLAGKIIRSYNPSYTFHDFRLSEKDGKTVLNFDLIIPFDENGKMDEIESGLTQLFSDICPEVTAEINIEHSFV